MFLKNASDDTKRKIALVASAAISLGIFVFWLVDFLPKATPALKDSKDDGVAFFGKLEENIANIYGGISEKFGEVKTQVNFIREHSDRE